jgi:thymidylate kinase
MLVIEGADVVGKTTLSRGLVPHLNQRGFQHMYMHLDRPPTCFDYYRGYLDKMSVHTVWDRFHLSNVVYRCLDGYPTGMTPMKYSLVDAQLRLIGGFVVVLYASDERTIEERWARKANAQFEMYDLEHAFKCNELYRVAIRDGRLMMRGGCYRTTVDFSIDVSSPAAELDELADELLNAYVRHLEEVTSL